MRILGPTLVLAAELLFVFVTYVYFKDLVHLVYEQYGAVQGTLWTGFGVWCLLNVHFNHLMAIFTSPGNPPEQCGSVRTCRECQFTSSPERKPNLALPHYCRWGHRPRSEACQDSPLQHLVCEPSVCFLLLLRIRSLITFSSSPIILVTLLSSKCILKMDRESRDDQSCLCLSASSWLILGFMRCCVCAV